MKWIIVVLALALVLQTFFTLSRLPDSTEEPTGSQPPTEYKALTTEVKRLSTDVARLKTRVAVLETGTATPTSTSVPIPHFVVDRERVNAREGPGVAFAVIGTVAQGERFDVQGSNAAGNWYLFCCAGGKSGWIYAPLLKVTHREIIPVVKDIPPVPPTNTLTPTPASTNTPTPIPASTNTPTPTSTPSPDWPRIASENRCSPYDSDDYSYPQSVEPQIVNRMGGSIYSPYTGRYFASTGETDIEHIVARSEAHDSGLCAASDADRRAFARDLLNLTLASPSVNRHEKGAKDVAEWLPAMNVCWYVNRVVEVKRKYDLTMDENEAQAAMRILSGCPSTVIIFAATPTSPSPVTVTPTPPQCPRNCSEAHQMGLSNMGTDHLCYRRSLDRDGDGIACER